MAIVYRATCTVNGKSYVGFTGGSLAERRRVHEAAARSYGETKGCRLFNRALLKHGPGSFCWEVLVSGLSKASAAAAEALAIWTYGTQTPAGYNITGGGEVPEWTAESRALVSARHRGRQKSQQERKNMSAAQKGRSKPEKEAERLRTLRVGVKLSPEHKAAVSRKGLTNSALHNTRISDAHRVVSGELLEKARALLAAGMSPPKVAKQLGFARSTGYRIKNRTHGY